MMPDTSFRALVVREGEGGAFTRAIEDRRIEDLPAGDVLVEVAYSSLNYKDALSATGNRGVTRRYPHTPGIDAAGAVAESAVDAFSPGDRVVVIGHDLGMNTPGGFGRYIRVPAEWVVKLPRGLAPRDSMVYGTAGFTAAMSVDAIERHGVGPDRGPALVTGATGGVGCMAVGILARAGYEVVAATGKADAAEFLEGLGARRVVPREEVVDTSRPLLKARWSAVVDCVGGDTLASALAATDHGGAVAACGLVGSPQLATTVFPFILRAVALFGIDSAHCDAAYRRRIWDRIAGEWRIRNLDTAARECPLDALDPEFDRILAGGQRGRVVVRVG